MIENAKNLCSFLKEKFETISNCFSSPAAGIAPDIVAMCTPSTAETSKSAADDIYQAESGELNIEGLDDNEIDGYIMNEDESRSKDEMWNKLNAEYLKEAKAKEERLAREREDGKPEKKKRRVTKKKNIGPSNTAGEAIEKMLQEKKISSKINYDILKTLTEPQIEEAKAAEAPASELLEIRAEASTSAVASQQARKP